jgi:hypothetical protein
MIKRLVALVILLAMAGANQASAAPSKWEYQGRASTGEKVALDLNSIQVVAMSVGRQSRPSYWFTYQIGNEQLFALTPCDGRWQVSQDGDMFGSFMEPKSGATRNMIGRVCQYQVKTATVFAPPSNVRNGPSENDNIRCSIPTRTEITTYGSDGDWFYTDACGKLGLIHSSQIKF